VYATSDVNAGRPFAPVDAGACVADRSGRPLPARRIMTLRAGFFFFWRSRRNRRGHRLGLLLARQHPEWDLYRSGPDALDLALLLALLAFLEILVCGMI
jgi:hypothetical protein